MARARPSWLTRISASTVAEGSSVPTGKPTALRAETGMRECQTSAGSPGASGTVYGIGTNCGAVATGRGADAERSIRNALRHATAATPAAAAHLHTGTGRRSGRAAIT